MKLVIMIPYMFALGSGVNRSFEGGVIQAWPERADAGTSFGGRCLGQAEHDGREAESASHLNRFAAFPRKPIQPAFFSASAWIWCCTMVEATIAVMSAWS